MTKTCRKCGEAKDLEDFPAQARMKDGRSSWCRACHVARTREWRAANREAYREAKREQYREMVELLGHRVRPYTRAKAV